MRSDIPLRGPCWARPWWGPCASCCPHDRGHSISGWRQSLRLASGTSLPQGTNTQLYRVGTLRDEHKFTTEIQIGPYMLIKPLPFWKKYFIMHKRRKHMNILNYSDTGFQSRQYFCVSVTPWQSVSEEVDTAKLLDAGTPLFYVYDYGYFWAHPILKNIDWYVHVCSWACVCSKSAWRVVSAFDCEKALYIATAWILFTIMTTQRAKTTPTLCAQELIPAPSQMNLHEWHEWKAAKIIPSWVF